MVLSVTAKKKKNERGIISTSEKVSKYYKVRHIIIYLFVVYPLFNKQTKYRYKTKHTGVENRNSYCAKTSNLLVMIPLPMYDVQWWNTV